MDVLYERCCGLDIYKKPVTKHPTAAHLVADLRRHAPLWLRARLAAIITPVLEDFEPVPGLPAAGDRRESFPAMQRHAVRRGAVRRS